MNRAAPPALALAALLLFSGEAAAQSVPPSITAVDQTPARPFSLITISGSGFQPGAAEIAVRFLPQAPNIATSAIPVHLATPTQLTIAVPPLVDRATGQFTSGPVGLQVVQTTEAEVMTSNVLSGFSVSALPSVAASVVPGTVTKAYLQSGLEVVAVARAIAPPNSPLEAMLRALATDHTQLVEAIKQVIANPAINVNRPTSDGNPFTLNAAVLATSDQLIAAYLDEVVLLSSAAPATSDRAGPTRSVDECMASNAELGSTDIVRTLCANERVAREQPQNTPAGQQRDADWTVPEWMVQLALFDEAARGHWANASKAFQLAWTTTADYLTVYLALNPRPRLSDPIAIVGTKLLERLSAEGIPVTLSDLAANAAIKAETINVNTNPTVRGLMFSILDDTVEVMRIVTACPTPDPWCVTPTRYRVPTGQSVVPTLTALVPPPPTNFFDGDYTGLVHGTWRRDPNKPPDSNCISGCWPEGTVDEDVLFNVTNGKATVTAPGNGTAIISETGRIVLGGVVVEDFLCTFGGNVAVDPVTGQANAAGDYSCSYRELISDGRWSASRSAPR